MSLLWALLALPAVEVPVYMHATEAILVRAGTFQYRPTKEGYEMLYCVTWPPRVTLRCVVRTPADRLVLIEATATEQGS